MQLVLHVMILYHSDGSSIFYSATLTKDLFLGNSKAIDSQLL